MQKIMIKAYLLLILVCISYCDAFAVRHWGENCSHSDECFDHRMVCVPDEDNVTKCFCNRFHEWNGSSVGCVQMFSVSYIMNHTVTVHDNVGHLSRIQELMYRGPIYSIFFMIFVIAGCIVSVIVYCLYVRSRDNRLKQIVVTMMRNNENSSRQSRRAQQLTSQC